MRTGYTRRRFLTAVSAGVTYLALSNTVGCDLRERTAKVRPKPNGSPAPSNGVWAFRSRRDISPPAVEVTTQAHSQAPGFIFIAPKLGPGQHGPLIIDDLGRPVWFREVKYALDFKVQHYHDKPVLTWWEGERFPRPQV